MSNYSIKINLAKLDGASLQTNPNTGKRALIIPVDDADLFVGQTGAVYLDLSMWEHRSGANQYGYTHGIKKSYSKSARERIGSEQVKLKPFIGDAKPITNLGNQVQQQDATNNYDW